MRFEMNEHKVYAISVSIFVIVFALYINSSVITSSDSRWSLHTAMSIIKEGNTDLDEYIYGNEKIDYTIQLVNGHYYTIFPIGASIVAVPFVYVIDTIITKFPIVEEYIKSRLTQPPIHISVISVHRGVELFIASIVVALTTVIIFLIAQLFLSKRYSLLITFIFGFCTSSWSVASRALWQHGPSMLML